MPDTVAVIGHFAEGTERIDGQIYRTRLVADELEARVPGLQVVRVDTARMREAPLRTILSARAAFRVTSHVIIMPGIRGLRWLFPWYLRWKRKWGNRVHYLAVGGWLPSFLQRNPKLLPALAALDGVHVQARIMVSALQEMGLVRVHHLPNFRRFEPPKRASSPREGPLRLVFLSRVIPAKGVDIAMEAVERANAETEQPCTLDIWGPVPAEHRAWFEDLLHRFSSSSRYHGVLAPEDIQAALTERDALLFPTAYSGEGFPGVIIDAYSAGMPVVATCWPYAEEAIEDGVSGILLKERSVDALKATLIRLTADRRLLAQLSSGATDRARAYHVDHVLPPLLLSLGLVDPDPEGTPCSQMPFTKRSTSS